MGHGLVPSYKNLQVQKFGLTGSWLQSYTQFWLQSYIQPVAEKSGRHCNTVQINMEVHHIVHKQSVTYTYRRYCCALLMSGSRPLSSDLDSEHQDEAGFYKQGATSVRELVGLGMMVFQSQACVDYGGCACRRSRAEHHTLCLGM